MTQEDNSNSDSGKISWFPYVLVVTAILVIGVVVLSMNGKKEAPQQITDATQQPVAETSEATYKIVSDPNFKERKVRLPYTNNATQNGELFTFVFNLTHKKGAPTEYNIKVDDCIEEFKINGQNVPLEGDAQINRCNWSRGFFMDLKPYLKEGTNKFFIKGKNGSGPSGLKVYLK